MEQVFPPYFPPLKPRYLLRSGASYSTKNMVHLMLCYTYLMNQVRLTENVYFKYQLINCKKGFFSNGIIFES